MGGGDVTVATVTHCQGLDKGLLASGRASVRPGEVRRGQGRKGLAQGCRGRRGASHLGAPGPVLQAHHVPLLPQGWQRSVRRRNPGPAGAEDLQALTVDVHHVRNEAAGPRLEGAR